MTDISLQPFSQFAIGLRHPLMLPQVLAPGTYDKSLDKSVRRFQVVEDTPSRRSVPAADTPVATNCLQQFFGVLWLHLIFHCYQYRTRLVATWKSAVANVGQRPMVPGCQIHRCIGKAEKQR
jgi:hypothetical protein